MTKVEEGKLLINEIQKDRTKLEALSHTNELLADQNRSLGVRAAVCFDELTPRYSGFAEAFVELNLNPPPAESKGGSKRSSLSYIQVLLNAYKSLKNPIPVAPADPAPIPVLEPIQGPQNATPT